MAAMFLFALLLWVKPMDAQAASTKQINMKANKTYKSYDITGDKKKDSIRVKTTNTSLAVVVNGKTVYTDKTEIEGGTEIQYCQLGNGMPFLFIRGYGVNEMCMSAIVYYKSGKPASLDLGNHFKKYAWIYHISDLELSENSFTATFSVMFQSTGITYLAPHKFVYKKGAIVNSSKLWDSLSFPMSFSSSACCSFRDSREYLAERMSARSLPSRSARVS